MTGPANRICRFFNHICFALVLLVIFVICGSHASGNSLQAEEITLEKLLKKGIANNYEIHYLKEQIDGLEREMTGFEQSQDWQFVLNGDTIYSGGNGYQLLAAELNPDLDFNEIEDNGPVMKVGLAGSKTYLNGLKLNSNINLQEAGTFSLSHLDNKLLYSFSLSDRLYPDTPTDLEKEVMRTEDELAMTIKRLHRESLEKMAEWSGDYLNLFNLTKKVEIAREQYNLARHNLETVKGKKEIGEGGKEQILEAEINLKEAAIGLKHLENEERQLREKLKNKVGIKSEFAISLDNNYLTELRERVKQRCYSLEDHKKMFDLLKRNPELQLLKRQIEQVTREIAWLREESGLEVNSTGSYEQKYGSEAEWQVGLNFSYSLSNGDRDEIALKDKKAELDALEREHLKISEDLKVQLDDFLTELELSRFELEVEELNYQKLILSNPLYEKQFELGLISSWLYRDKVLKLEEAKIELKAARDRLFISRLKLIAFLGDDIFTDI